MTVCIYTENINDSDSVKTKMTGILGFSKKRANDHCKLTVIWADKKLRAQARSDNISRFGFCKVYRFNLTATCELSLICRRDILSRGSSKASNINSTEGRHTLWCGEGEGVGGEWKITACLSRRVSFAYRPFEDTSSISQCTDTFHFNVVS